MKTIQEMALEALNEWGKGFPDLVGDLDKQVISAIKEALAQPKQELVCVCGAIWEGQELICAPPQRKPLTDEQIADIVIEMNGNEPTALFWRDLARAIEAAHGIEDKT